MTRGHFILIILLLSFYQILNAYKLDSIEGKLDKIEQILQKKQTIKDKK